MALGFSAQGSPPGPRGHEATATRRAQRVCWPLGGQRVCSPASPERAEGPSACRDPTPTALSRQVPTVVDYKDVLLTLVPMAPRTQHLCGFLCELSLLHTSLAAYAPAHLAAAALLLARLTHGQSKRPVLPARLSELG